MNSMRIKAHYHKKVLMLDYVFNTAVITKINYTLKKVCVDNITKTIGLHFTRKYYFSISASKLHV